MKALRDEIVEKKIGWGSMEVMTSVLMDMLRDRLQIDNLIILKTDEATSDFSKVFPDSSYLHKYRLLVNANLLYVNVNLDKARPLVAMNQVADSHENDIYISGYSDQILRFVAERGGGGQLLHVEQIDKAYNLNKIKVLSSFPQQSSPISETATTPRQSPAPKWRTVRVFISSTFKDMHGERDLLTRFVFPELRARAKLKFINVYEVDLRWGVTEKEMHSDKGIDICLSEVAKCDFFIGLLGDRYGWIPSSYLVSDTPDFDWLKTYPPGRSITELEIQQAVAAGRDKAEETAFFYFRDSTFLSTVPENIKPLFTDENPDVQKKTADIKEQIRKSGCEVFDNYPCYWGGVIDCKPMVTGLEQFGSRVLNNLWTAITRKYPDEDAVSDQLSEEGSLHAAFAEQRKKSFVGRKNLLKQAQSLIEKMEEGVIAFVGKPGCGRTSLMSAFLYQYADSAACKSRQYVLSHFVGATPGSTNIATTLTRIMLELKSRFHLPKAVPSEFHEMVTVFPKFLTAAIEACGISSCLVLFMDGLDVLDAAHQAHTLDWLPDPMPKGIVFVVSVVDGGQCLASLNRRAQKTELISVGGLDMFDKAEVVRQSLKQHRKTLDESPFNNQMKLLLNKRDAAVPLFLSIACEEIRVFGVFEKVSEKLKKMPASLSGLLQDVLQRLESDLGQDILSAALLFLCCCRSGLTESELISLLRLHQSGLLQQKQSPFSPAIKDALRNDASGSIPQVRFAQLVRSLQSFLQPTVESSEGLLVLAHAAVVEAVKHHYKKCFSSEQNLMFHLLLSAYFYWEADPKGNKSFDGNNKRAMSELPYHLTSSGLWSELEAVVCNLQYIEQKCLLGLGRQLPNDFLLEQKDATIAQQWEPEKFLQQQTITVH
jgi:telomerase protein component 1